MKVGMKAILSLGLGYFFGCINPAAWIGKKKNVDLSQSGTKNLGATNTALVLGKHAGYFVLIFDMFKSLFSYRLARWIFPQLGIAGLLGGIGAIIGHCFPVFMNFQGGKGLASFGGLVLAHDPAMFALLLTIGVLSALVLDYGVYLAISTALLFPVTALIRSHSVPVFATTSVASGIILAMHRTNLHRAITGEDPIRVRDGLKKIFGKNK